MTVDTERFGNRPSCRMGTAQVTGINRTDIFAYEACSISSAS